MKALLDENQAELAQLLVKKPPLNNFPAFWDIS